MHAMIATALLDVVEIEKADKEQESSIADRHDHKGNSAHVLHLPVELEVAFPAQSLVTPLHHSTDEEEEKSKENRMRGRADCSDAENHKRLLHYGHNDDDDKVSKMMQL